MLVETRKTIRTGKRNMNPQFPLGWAKRGRRLRDRRQLLNYLKLHHTPDAD